MNLALHALKVTTCFICVAIIIGAGMVLIDRHWNRGYCIATGDFSDSDNFTILTDFYNHNEGWVLGKDGKKYFMKICPDTTVAWHPGEVIVEAHYEYRNGCSSFASSQAYFRLRRDNNGKSTR